MQQQYTIQQLNQAQLLNLIEQAQTVNKLPNLKRQQLTLKELMFKLRTQSITRMKISP